MNIRQDAAYIKNPFFCPFCKSDEIDAGPGMDPFENMAYQSVRCVTCETEWHDIFELVGYEEVVAGKDSHA